MGLGRCPACPGVHNCLPPDGSGEEGGVLFIGEAPGGDEDRKKRVFVGKTGQEVDLHYLPVAGLRRQDVTIVNTIACLPNTPGGKLKADNRKHLELADACANYQLYPLIERLRPRALVPMGGFACRAILGEFDLELRHGIPTESPWGIPAFPMYHPALGIHEPKKMLYIRTDWHRLREWLAGRLELPVDPYPRPDYAEVTDVAEIEAIDPDSPLAADTESKRGGEPFCFTFSQRPGVGRLVRADRHDLLVALNVALQKHRHKVLFHNWLYDAAVVSAMGLAIHPHRIVDTMARVFHLGNLPQGLKALAFRLLGMEMEDFDDLVLPFSRERVVNYYKLASFHDYPKPEEQLVADGMGGYKLYKPQSMSTKLKRFFTDLSKNPEGKDVFGVWDGWDQEAIETNCGPWPGICISHVPFERTLHYACRDADALIRLWPLLRRMRTQVRRTSQEKWTYAA